MYNKKNATRAESRTITVQYWDFITQPRDFILWFGRNCVDALDRACVWPHSTEVMYGASC